MPRGQFDAYLPLGFPGRQGVQCLIVDPALVLCLQLLCGLRHWRAGVFPFLFDRVPAIEREVSRQLSLGEYVTDDPVSLARRVLGSGVQEDVGTVGGNRDTVAEPAAHVLFDLVLTHGLNRLLDVVLIPKRDRHSPVFVCHRGDSIAVPGVLLPAARLCRRIQRRRDARTAYKDLSTTALCTISAR